MALHRGTQCRTRHAKSVMGEILVLRRPQAILDAKIMRADDPQTKGGRPDAILIFLTFTSPL